MITFKIGAYAVTVPDDFDVDGWEAYSLKVLKDPDDALQVMQVAAAARLAMQADRVPAWEPLRVVRATPGAAVNRSDGLGLVELPHTRSDRPGWIVRLLGRVFGKVAR